LFQRKTAVNKNQLPAHIDHSTVAPAATSERGKSSQLANSRSMLNTC
jgi:hypothetical protein